MIDDGFSLQVMLQIGLFLMVLSAFFCVATILVHCDSSHGFDWYRFCAGRLLVVSKYDAMLGWRI